MISPAVIIIALLVFVSLILSFVLGWNNSGLMAGNLSNLVNYRTSLGVTLAGVFLGLMLEGSKMTHSIVGNLITLQPTNLELLVGAASSLALFLPLAVARIPVSLSNCVVGAFVGVALSDSTSISSRFLTEVVGSWLMAPLVCLLVAVAFYEVISRAMRSTSLTTASWASRMILLGSVFYVAYALGANNGGMIFSFISQSTNPESSTLLLFLVEISIYIAIVLGTTMFGEPIATIVGGKIVQLSGLKTVSALLSTAFVAWTFTQFSIPVSLTQMVIGGMVGAGIARGPTIVNRFELFSMVWHWVLVTVLCTLLGYAIGYSLHIINL